MDMNDVVYVLVCEEAEQCGGNFTIMKASFDLESLEKEAGILNSEYIRLRDLMTAVVKETKKRCDISGSWYTVQQAVIQEMVDEGERHKITCGNLGSFYKVIPTEIIHHRTESLASRDDTR